MLLVTGSLVEWLWPRIVEEAFALWLWSFLTHVTLSTLRGTCSRNAETTSVDDEPTASRHPRHRMERLQPSQERRSKEIGRDCPAKSLPIHFSSRQHDGVHARILQQRRTDSPISRRTRCSSNRRISTRSPTGISSLPSVTCRMRSTSKRTHSF